MEFTPVALANRNDAEALYRRLVAVPSQANEPLRLNLAHASFVGVDGLLALVTIGRLWHSRTQQPVILCNIPPTVHQYLERIDLFSTCGGWIKQERELPSSERYDRVSESVRLLEIMRVDSNEGQNAKDVARAIGRANHILSNWFGRDLQATGQLCTMLAEIASNIVHSADHGYAVIQRHRDPDNPLFGSRIWIAIADLGVGIEGSLSSQHSRLEPQVRKQLRRGSDYLLQSLEMGVTARRTAGGTGLHWVRSMVQDWRGTLSIRSRRSLVVINEDKLTRRDDLIEVPGTQVTIFIRGS